MDVLVIRGGCAATRDPGELPALLKLDDALVWVDVPVDDPAAAPVLSEIFGFHSLAVRDCVERNHVAKFHVYADHVFVVLHSPHLGRRGHVHYVELDQFVGRNYLVTVHGPLNPVLDAQVAEMDTRAVRHRIDRGASLPDSPFDLSRAVVSAQIRREIDLVAKLAAESGRLERRVMLGEERDDPSGFLEELFQIWYELLAVRTMAVHSAAAYARMARQIRDVPDAELASLADLADQFDLVRSMADGQREFLHGVIEFYQTRISTQTTVAAEKAASTGVQQNDDMRRITAWVAIVAVPTAVTGFFGQNVPYPGFGERVGFFASLILMLIMAVALYAVFRHKRWL